MTKTTIVQDVQWIPLASITVREGFNHRLRFDDADQAVLEDQICTTKEVELLGVRRRPDIIDDETGEPQIELVKGERRLRALIELAKSGRLPEAFIRNGHACAPCRVLEFEGDFRAFLLSYMENVGRKDVTWIERITAVAQADAAYRAEHPNAKQADVAKALSMKTPNLSVATSIARQWWFNELRKAYVDTGAILMTEQSARALAPKTRTELAIELVKKAVESGEPVSDERVTRLTASETAEDGAEGGEGSEDAGSGSGKKGSKKKGGGGAGFTWGVTWPEARELYNRCNVAAKKAAADKGTIAEESELVFKEVAAVLDWVLKPGKKLPKLLETSLDLYAPIRKANAATQGEE